MGTYALPVSGLLIPVVFGWRADLAGIQDDLGWLYPLVRYLVPPALVVVTLAKGLGVARPAWRLLVARVPGGLGASVLAGALIGLLAVAGWLVPDRLPYPRCRR